MTLQELFQGYEHAHGRFEVKRTDERGKANGRAFTVKEPPSADLWKVHIEGTGPGLGIIPLRQDDTIVWGCIDIDVIGIDHKALVAKAKELGLPLVVARSKSGGAHAFLFLSEPVPADMAQTSLAAWSAALGHGGCEIFPKQTTRFNADDIGNWLNMPYYSCPRTLRYGYDDEGVEILDPAAFVTFAQGKQIDGEQLAMLDVAQQVKPDNGGLFEEGPPCLQMLLSKGGFPEGTRNDGMYNVVVYLRKRFPDGWQDKIGEYNVAMSDPQLGLSEINVLAKSVGRKDYGFRCNQQPIKPHCNRKLCLTRMCGVGDSPDGGDDGLEISGVTKYLGDPVIWFLDVNGQRLMVTTDELQSQTRFQVKVMEHLSRFFTPVPAARWAKFIDAKIRDCDTVEIPEDATPSGQMKMLVDQYVRGQAQATSKEELAHRYTPYRTGQGEVWFRSRGLLEYLTRHGHKYPSEHHVWQTLRGLGAENRFLNVGGKGFNVWCLPDTDGPEPEVPLPEFGTEAF
jgi:hypothetical protein